VKSAKSVACQAGHGCTTLEFLRFPAIFEVSAIVSTSRRVGRRQELGKYQIACFDKRHMKTFAKVDANSSARITCVNTTDEFLYGIVPKPVAI